jgi:hypothetical protein
LEALALAYPNGDSAFALKALLAMASFDFNEIVRRWVQSAELADNFVGSELVSVSFVLFSVKPKPDDVMVVGMMARRRANFSRGNSTPVGRIGHFQNLSG